MNQCALTPGKVFLMIDHPLRVHRIYPTQMTLQQLYHDHGVSHYFDAYIHYTLLAVMKTLNILTAGTRRFDGWGTRLGFAWSS